MSYDTYLSIVLSNIDISFRITLFRIKTLHIYTQVITLVVIVMLS